MSTQLKADRDKLIKSLKEAYQTDSVETSRTCACYPHRDVGDKSKKCEHGCVYCMANPKVDF